MIDNLNEHYSITNPASVYDEEAMTALELAARLAAKVAECITEVNQIDQKVAAKTLEHIKNGDFDVQIDEHTVELITHLNDVISSVNAITNNLTNRVDNLVLNAGGNSEPEVIDARIGYDKTYTTLGEALRKQFEKSLKRIDDVNEFDNLSDVNEMGVVYVSASKAWGDLPEGEQGGFLLNLTSTYVVGRVQLFIGYTENVYFRKYLSDRFGNWRKLLTDGEVLCLRQVDVENGGEFDFDTLTDTGLYRVSSSYEHNAPEDAGMLIVYGTDVTTQCYQMFIGYFGGLYYHGINSSGVFNPWKSVGSGSSSNGSASVGREYTLVKEDDDTVYIYKRGVKGYVRYTLLRHFDTSINLRTYRLGGIDVCDENRNVIDNVCETGVDVEGVIKLKGATDHIGGVHGHEEVESYTLLIDGVDTLFEEVEDDTESDHIVLSVISYINLDEGSIYREKRVVFDKDGVEIFNQWLPELDLEISTVRASMMSVNKNLFTHYYTNLTLPTLRNDENKTESLMFSYDETEVTYIGDVYVKHSVLERNGDVENCNLLIQDYGQRLKSYFNSFTNATAICDEPIYARGKIYITY